MKLWREGEKKEGKCAVALSLFLHAYHSERLSFALVKKEKGRNREGRALRAFPSCAANDGPALPPQREKNSLTYGTYFFCTAKVEKKPRQLTRQKGGRKKREKMSVRLSPSVHIGFGGRIQTVPDGCQFRKRGEKREEKRMVAPLTKIFPSILGRGEDTRTPTDMKKERGGERGRRSAYATNSISTPERTKKSRLVIVALVIIVQRGGGKIGGRGKPIRTSVKSLLSSSFALGFGRGLVAVKAVRKIEGRRKGRGRKKKSPQPLLILSLKTFCLT